jgi:hypothetical protein
MPGALILLSPPFREMSPFRRVMPRVGGIRDREIKTYLLYFTDFPWLPDAPVDDVISTARVRGNWRSQGEASYVRPRPRCLRFIGRVSGRFDGAITGRVPQARGDKVSWWARAVAVKSCGWEPL